MVWLVFGPLSQKPFLAESVNEAVVDGIDHLVRSIRHLEHFDDVVGTYRHCWMELGILSYGNRSVIEHAHTLDAENSCCNNNVVFFVLRHYIST